MSDKVRVLSSSSFDSVVLKSDKPVLVDFWAPWCGPCRIVGPTVESLANKVGDKAVVAKLNVDDAQDIAQRYGVMAIPTLIVFKNGEPVERTVGVASEAALTSMLGG
jgi:thioredoxin 1